MNPELIKQLRQELKKSGIKVPDIYSYAKSVGISTKRGVVPNQEPKPEEFQPAVSAPATKHTDASVLAGDPKLAPVKQELKNYILKNLKPHNELASVIDPLITKVDLISDARLLNDMALNIKKIHDTILQVKKAGPKAASVMGEIVSASAQQALKKNPELAKPVPDPGTTPNITTDDQITYQINSLLNKPSRAAYVQISKTLGMQGAKSQDNTLTVTGEPDDMFLIKNLGSNQAAMYPGFGFRSNLGYWTSDDGRTFDTHMGGYFARVNSDMTSVVTPAIVDMKTLKVIRKGKMELPIE